MPLTLAEVTMSSIDKTVSKWRVSAITADEAIEEIGPKLVVYLKLKKLWDKIEN